MAEVPDFGQATDLPLDSHLHTDLSPDSEVPIDAYAEQAVERGIAEIAITDHVDFDPRLPAFEYATYDHRLRVARDAAERWAGRGLAIRFGCELTYAARFEDAIQEHLRRHRYDFTIGSVHIGPDSPYKADRVAAFCSGRGLSEVCAPYFDEVLGAARSGLFDTLGHLDFVKRYVAGHVDTFALRTAPELYEPILRALVDTGMALEINVSGLRQAANETYPSEAIVALYRDIGGRRVTTGSDAHRADSFAFGLDEGYRIAGANGYGSVAFRRGGDAVDVAVPERFLTRARVA
jgi:histidinol-phosphatase (PHP family)